MSSIAQVASLRLGPRVRSITVDNLVTSSHELIFTRKNQRVSKLLGRVAVITHSLTRYARSGAI